MALQRLEQLRLVALEALDAELRGKRTRGAKIQGRRFAYEPPERTFEQADAGWRQPLGNCNGLAPRRGRTSNRSVWHFLKP